MNGKHDFADLTLREILHEHLGEPKTTQLINAIEEGIRKGLKGDALYEYIYETMCRLSINDYEVHLIIQVIPHIQKFVIP